MLQNYDDFSHPGEDQAIKPIVPDAENEFVRAKTFLQTGSTITGDNLYDHLTDVLNKILAERPENVIDFFEEYSRKVKEKRFKPLTDHLEDIYVHPPRYKLCKKWQPLLMPMPAEAPSTMDPEDMDLADMTRNNMLLLLYYFEQAGLGLPRNEMFALMMSMMRFVKTEPVSSVRFWGKIYGDYKNYIILETELKDEENAKRHASMQNKKDEDQQIREEEDSVVQAAREEQSQLKAIEEVEGEDAPQTTGIARPLPPMPVNHYQEVADAPEEPPGVGVNKKVYYVCNEVGDEWTQLPDVTPQQIVAARLIKKTITGNLSQSICTFPEFPGNETNYLRAQIARISAGSQISPLGYYTFSEMEGEGADDEEAEDEEEEGPRAGGTNTEFHDNPRYEGLPLNDLLDTSMAFWVHHAQYILPQGRTTWWNPNPDLEMPGEQSEAGEGGEEEEEEEAGDKPIGNRVEPETGPPLLTALSEDSSLDAVVPWSVRASSHINPQFALCVVRSNIWPGAYCFATQGKLFENIYLGNGLKYMSQNFSPKPLTTVQQDYPLGPEIMEMEDPTGAEEEAWRIAHLPKEAPPKGEMAGEGEEEEEEEEEDDEEEDDDD